LALLYEQFSTFSNHGLSSLTSKRSIDDDCRRLLIITRTSGTLGLSYEAYQGFSGTVERYYVSHILQEARISCCVLFEENSEVGDVAAIGDFCFARLEQLKSDTERGTSGLGSQAVFCLDNREDCQREWIASLREAMVLKLIVKEKGLDVLSSATFLTVFPKPSRLVKLPTPTENLVSRTQSG
jgi:hypothetical protein